MWEASSSDQPRRAELPIQSGVVIRDQFRKLRELVGSGPSEWLS